jgi:hypothetical protein
MRSCSKREDIEQLGEDARVVWLIGVEDPARGRRFEAALGQVDPATQPHQEPVNAAPACPGVGVGEVLLVDVVASPQIGDPFSGLRERGGRCSSRCSPQELFTTICISRA